MIEEYLNICEECDGLGKKKRKFKKHTFKNIQHELEQYKQSKIEGKTSIKPNFQLTTCLNCSGSGLVFLNKKPKTDSETFPHMAIIGGGIGGVALAVACMHRGIPFSLFERDANFETRSQGYGLTLQQASSAISGLGLFNLIDGVNSTKHIVHTSDGKVIGEWGMRKNLNANTNKPPKRTNVHIARQDLRLALLEQLKSNENVKWGHQLVDFKNINKNEIEISFNVDGEIIKQTTNLIVGADGIRSTVRKLLLGEDIAPLRYLGCIVILGICPLAALENTESPLLDSATVFQTANGNERIYMMPFTKDSMMWQLSFPMTEQEAKDLSAKGAKALKEEACLRTQWHSPIPQILKATLETQISGYPVYDRELLSSELLAQNDKVTLIGDAAHPMSPFKGQGANQALLDALALAREINKGCKPSSNWKTEGIRKTVLTEFESEMLERSAVKVKTSADAAHFLHSEMVLDEGNEPRGRDLRNRIGN